MPLSLILGATASTRTNLLAATKGYDCAQFKQNSWASFSTRGGESCPSQNQAEHHQQTSEHTHHDNISHPPILDAAQPRREPAYPSVLAVGTDDSQRGTTAGALPPVVDANDLTSEFRRQVLTAMELYMLLFSALWPFDSPDPTRQPSAAPPSAAAASEIPKKDTTVYSVWLAKFRDVVVVWRWPINRFAMVATRFSGWGRPPRYSPT
ncbi:hypothetical protein CCHR01_16940 [Colletotrichum chrysophilum]|uniref:Uncharacterized protein n=1 Tax=Colletotrichum chrysophilum TaxID=1836956 RepID=A0AAD9A7J7_9PEZI|nr:hypothetical protein CCHR01_16940 [Colletotrichum chrysophilum]